MISYEFSIIIIYIIVQNLSLIYCIRKESQNAPLQSAIFYVEVVKCRHLAISIRR